MSSVIREQPSLHGSVLSLICHVDFQIILCRAVARIHVHGGVHHGLHNEHQIVLTPFESVPPPRVKMCIVPAGRDCFFLGGLSLIGFPMFYQLNICTLITVCLSRCFLSSDFCEISFGGPFCQRCLLQINAAGV